MLRNTLLAASAAGSMARVFGAFPARYCPIVLDAGGTGTATEDDLRRMAADLKTATDEVKRFAERATSEMKSLGTVSGETKDKADKALLDMNALATRVADIEQKIVKRVASPSGGENRTIGHIVIDNPEVKAQLASGRDFKGRLQVEVKDVTSASTSGTSGTTGLVVADRQPGIVQVLPNRKLVIRDLLMPGHTTSQSIDYVRETLYTNNAGMVAEDPSAPKPQSDIVFDMKNQPVRTLAHYVLASKQIMSDAPMLQSYIDGRLRYGLAYVEDLALLLGDGTGINLLGLMPQATAYAAPAGVSVTSPTMIDTLRLAMLQATLALYPATGTVLHPTDWASIELTKDSMGRYIFANPTGVAGPTLWGLPIAESLAMPQNNFLTGALRYAAQIFDREDATVLMSTEDRDNFVRNMVTILCEERLALCVYRPQALIKGTFK